MKASLVVFRGRMRMTMLLAEESKLDSARNCSVMGF
jgi:hypothetical protein